MRFTSSKALLSVFIFATMMAGPIGCFETECGGQRDLFDPVTILFEATADIYPGVTFDDFAEQTVDLHNHCLSLLEDESGTLFGYVKTVGWDGMVYDNTIWQCVDGSCTQCIDGNCTEN